jgi:hypothetical protein
MAKEANVSWRPKNWRKKLPKINSNLADWKIKTYREVGIARHAFEAGADAMLAAATNEIFTAIESGEVTPGCQCGCWERFKAKFSVKHSSQNGWIAERK